MDGPEYTKHVGVKFLPDGRPRAFPGNTVVCMLPAKGSAWRVISEAQAMFQDFYLDKTYSRLPPESFHMTLSEGVCDQVRQENFWPGRLPLDMPLAGVNADFKAIFLGLSRPSKVVMRYDTLRCHDVLLMTLKPADEETAGALRGFRDDFSRATGLRFPDHEEYFFHLSLAYQLRAGGRDLEERISLLHSRAHAFLAENLGEIEFRPPEFCTFRDMFLFSPY